MEAGAQNTATPIRLHIKRARIVAWIAAQVAFFYIIAVAILKRPLLV